MARKKWGQKGKVESGELKAEMGCGREYPLTVAQAVAALQASLSPEYLQPIHYMQKEQLPELHYPIGLDISDKFGLHGDNQPLLAECHTTNPIEAAAVIIEALWVYLNPNGPPANPPPPSLIISSGQSGAARAALDYATSTFYPASYEFLIFTISKGRVSKTGTGGK